MTENPKVDVHLIVRNGEKYMRRCLEAVRAQTYSNIEFRIFDNASEDSTLAIAKDVYPDAKIVKFPKNYSLGGGFNRSLKWSDSPYVVGLSVDVAMAEDFIERAVESMERNKSVGALQAKIYRYNYESNENTDIIDTVGMKIYKSRRVINIGHGEKDIGQHNHAGEVFSYEGAAPFFRREALEDAKMKRFRPLYAPYADEEDLKEYEFEYLDEDFTWYADEVDLGWRMRLLGWGSWYEPAVVAYHDRQTTHKLSGGKRSFIKLRRTIPASKRKLDLRNLRLTFIKNSFWVNIIVHIPWILKRELLLFVYVLFWERTSLPAYFQAIKMSPKILNKRREIVKKRQINAKEIRRWFQ